MKKTSFFICLLCVILTMSACSQSNRPQNSELLPSEFRAGDKVLSYFNSNAEDFENAGVATGEHPFAFDNSGVVVIDGKVRALVVRDDSIDLYEGVAVGDSISKIKSLFKYEMIYEEGTWQCYFKDGTEVDFSDNVVFNDSKKNSHDYLCVSGGCDDNGKISLILISDCAYARNGE